MESTPTTLPPGRIPKLRGAPSPAPATAQGAFCGGCIWARVYLAGARRALRRANGRIATIAVNSFLFKQPVFVGDVLSFYADVVRVGRTSITVFVEVYAQRNQLNDEIVKVTEATLTYVATDDQRRPRPLPPA